MDALAVRQHESPRNGDAVVPTRTAVLRLRPAPTAAETEQAERQRAMRVSWDPQVREPVNQQVSKCCCVFHKKKLFGESSSDSSSSSDSDDDDQPSPMPGGNGGGAPDDAAAGGHSHDGCAHGCTHDEKPRKRRPKCTKEHCYCGTTFH